MEDTIPSLTLKKRSPKKLALWIGCGLLGIGVVVGVIFWLAAHFGNAQLIGLKEKVKSTKPAFTVFYPKTLPEKVEAADDPVDASGNIITYVLKQGGNRIIVTQQASPTMTEELTKVKDVPVPVGKAYIATLNERKAGFMWTNKTLLIISSSQDLDASILEALLQSMDPL